MHNRRQKNRFGYDKTTANFLGEVKSGIDSATAVLESAMKFLSYFRTDVTLQPEVFDVDEKVDDCRSFSRIEKTLRGKTHTL